MAMMNLTITAEDCLCLANPKGCYHVRWLNMDIIHQVVHPARALYRYYYDPATSTIKIWETFLYRGQTFKHPGVVP